MFKRGLNSLTTTVTSTTGVISRSSVQRSSFHSSSIVSAGLPQLNVHRDSDDNNEDTEFEWSAASLKRIEQILAKYPSNYKQAGALPVLDVAQRQNGGWLSLAAMNAVADVCEMPRIRLYETASFYSMFNRRKIGKNFVQVCCTTPCMIRGSYDILDACEKHLGIKAGETTEDGKFTLIEVECLGACVNAPMAQIGDDYFEDLTKESIVDVLNTLAAGKQPKVGPQTHRKNCEGPQGQTTLLGDIPGPVIREGLFDHQKAADFKPDFMQK
eukprot:TRINITY_DN218_c1_g1_i6.p1 TRINITY_DN218_c1_g1~~TRINITY_DN218_c1_g1_i6.p1  ORF type:complete len:270 (+),score=68.41 TRINITY_DN218_c1_g1_i6:1318-2127(+)